MRPFRTILQPLDRRSFCAGSLAFCASAAWAEEVQALSFDMLYKSVGIMGAVFSDTLLAARGKICTLRGYMAPPLKAESTFFVLTREPMAICPFCQSDADWPIDIMVVYLADMTPLLGGGERVSVRGRLEIGSWTDPDTGFVSQLRLRDASFRRV